MSVADNLNPLLDFSGRTRFDAIGVGHADRPVLPRQLRAAGQAGRREVAVAPRASCDRFMHSFAHIFAGGYAAGYYS
jgi:Zn-dependent oligopeptidase